MKKLIVVLLGVLLLLPYSASAIDLKYGMKNNQEVRTLQQFLKDKGYYTINVTGNFYSLTQAAVKKFQKANGLKVTGVWNQISADKMNELAVNTEASPTLVVDSNWTPTPTGYVMGADGKFVPSSVINYPQAVAVANPVAQTQVVPIIPTPYVPAVTQTNNPSSTIVTNTNPPKATLEQYSIIQMMPPFTQRISGGSSLVIFGKSKLPYGNQENFCMSCIAIKTDKPTTLHLTYVDSFKDSDIFDWNKSYSDKIKTLDLPLEDTHLIMLKNISNGWPNVVYYKYSIKDSSGNEFTKNSWVNTAYDPAFDESSTMIDGVKTTY